MTFRFLSYIISLFIILAYLVNYVNKRYFFNNVAENIAKSEVEKLCLTDFAFISPKTRLF